jgi:hypothetical protein
MGNGAQKEVPLSVQIETQIPNLVLWRTDPLLSSDSVNNNRYYAIGE